VESATPSERRTLPFAPLAAAINQRIAIRRQQPGAHLRDLNDLGDKQRQRYYRAQRRGRITIDAADDLCDIFGWHPREIWTGREWDELAEYEADPERERIRRNHRAYRARKKARAEKEAAA